MSNLGAPHLHLHLARVPGGSGSANVRRAWIRTRTEMRQYVWIYVIYILYMCVCVWYARFILSTDPWQTWDTTSIWRNRLSHTSTLLFAEVTLSTHPVCYRPPPLGRGDLVLPPWNMTWDSADTCAYVFVWVWTSDAETKIIMPTLLTLSSPLECCQACKLMH